VGANNCRVTGKGEIDSDSQYRVVDGEPVSFISAPELNFSGICSRQQRTHTQEGNNCAAGLRGARAGECHAWTGPISTPHANVRSAYGMVKGLQSVRGPECDSNYSALVGPYVGGQSLPVAWSARFSVLAIQPDSYATARVFEPQNGQPCLRVTNHICEVCTQGFRRGYTDRKTQICARRRRFGSVWKEAAAEGMHSFTERVYTETLLEKLQIAFHRRPHLHANGHMGRDPNVRHTLFPPRSYICFRMLTQLNAALSNRAC
jgi:hypothetical protein